MRLSKLTLFLQYSSGMLGRGKAIHGGWYQLDCIQLDANELGHISIH